MGFRLDRLVWIGLLALVMACGGGSASGGGKRMLDPDDDARTGYEKALLDFRRGDCLSAEPMFREIRREFPYSRFAALAELRIGDCQFKNEAYPEAIQTYRQFVRIRPSHKEIPYARFRIAEAYYNQIPGGWFMTPPASSSCAGSWSTTLTTNGCRTPTSSWRNAWACSLRMSSTSRASTSSGTRTAA
jgi:outer membrane assembly lipoprotein YfiO